MSTFKDFGSGFCLVPIAQANELLQLSGFAVDKVQLPIEAITLGAQLRADEILEFEVTPIGRTSFQLKGRVLLARDRQGMLRDSIPKHEPGESQSIAAKAFLAEFKKVRAMLDAERKCFNAARDDKLPEAEAAAREALKIMPSSNIARICLASALHKAKKNPAEVIKLTDEVIASDPGNTIALELALVSYLAADNKEKYAEVGSRIIRIAPASVLAEDIIANLAQWKKTEIAIQLLEKALTEDPENVTLRTIEFRLILAGDNLKEAQKKGEALAKLDTAVVDTSFVKFMVSAYARDSSFEKAAEWLSRGTGKWPTNMAFAMQLAQTLRQLGQTQQAVDEYQRILKLNPQAREIRLQIANTYIAGNQPDSAFAWARRAAESGDDKSVAATLAVTIANRLLKAAQDTTGGRTPTAEDFKKVIPYAAYADSLDDLTGRFLWGLTAFYIANPMIQSIQPPNQPTCPVLKELREWLSLASEKILGGARAQPAAAGQILPGVNQRIEYVDSVIKAMKPACPGM
jgi:tetratricopeptide (TPR) repeat protein